MKGEVRSGVTVWLLAVVTCGLYALYWWYTVLTELKAYLGREQLNPTVDVVLLLVPIVNLVWPLYLPIKMGGLIRDAQAQAGMPAPEDKGILYLVLQCLCGFGYVAMQEDLNKVWTHAAPPVAQAVPVP